MLNSSDIFTPSNFSKSRSLKFNILASSSNSPAIDVHLSNIHKREEFRHKSYISGVVDGIIIGLGDQGYILAIDAVTKIMNERVS